MKLWAVAMVRNEADIIEAFVRHNLTVTDGLTVVDHGSVDETPRILGALQSEGLPLTVEVDRRVGFYQPEIMTEAIRRTLASTGADFVFALDADEFLKVRDRALLEHVLRGLPAGMHAALRWLTYVPDFSEQATDLVAIAKRARRLETERHGAFKVIIARHFLDTREAVLIHGNHSVFPRAGMPPGTTAPQAALAVQVAALAHLPIRTRAQFIAKVVVRMLGRTAIGRPYKPDLQTVAAYRAIRSGQPLSAAFLVDQAVNWTVTAGRRLRPDEVRLVEEPILADIALRYGGSSLGDPLVPILAAAEEIAAELARVRRDKGGA